MLNPQNTNRVMKTYISPKMLAAELDAAQGIMQVLTTSNRSAQSSSDVLTKRKMWDNDEDDDEW